LYGIPLCAGLLVAHAMIPPTPGPLAAASIIGADIGWVIIFGIVIGLIAMTVAGPMFGTFIANKIHVPVPEMMDEQAAAIEAELEKKENEKPEKELPNFMSVLSIILLPLILILLNTIAP